MTLYSLGGELDLAAQIGQAPEQTLDRFGAVAAREVFSAQVSVFGIVIPSNTNTSLPIQPAFGPGGKSANVLGFNPLILGSHVLPIVSQYNSDYVNQAKLSINWRSGKTEWEAGLQFVEDTHYGLAYSSFANNAWQLWAGYGSPSANVYGQALPPSLFTHSGSIDTSRFFHGFDNNSGLPPIPLFNPYVVYDYLQHQPANPGVISGPNPPSCTAGSLGCYSLYNEGPGPLSLDPGSISFVQEKTYSPFVTLRQENTLGMPLTMNLGFRYERSNVIPTGDRRRQTAPVVNPGGTTCFPQCNSLRYATAKSQYSYLLPSLDLKLLLLPDVKVRFDAARTH